MRVLAACLKALPPLPFWVRRFCERHFYDRYFTSKSPAQSRRRMFRGVYATWDEAVRAAPTNWKVGSDEAEQRRVASRNIRELFSRDYPVLFWISRLMGENTFIFDLGGSVGITYYAFQKYLAYPNGLRWVVCDQAGVIQNGRALANQEKSAGLTFTTRFTDANGADVLLIAGALHYFEQPLATLLDSLRDKPRHILLNKLPLHDGPAFVTLTHYAGGGIVPYHVFSRGPFFQAVCDQGYEVVDTWTNPDVSMVIPFHPEKTIDAFTGLYYRKSR